MSEPTSFEYDVFLSHSSKDKPLVRELAERLRRDGLRVWFDEWVLRLGDSIPAKIEEGLERSRLLVFCMSVNAFGSNWTSLESQTFRFRDPQNRDRRFLPVRFDDAPLKGSLGQFVYVDWRDPVKRDAGYVKMLSACRPSPVASEGDASRSARPGERQRDHRIERRHAGAAAEKFLVGGHTDFIRCVAWSPDGKLALSASDDRTIRLWEAITGRCKAVFEGHTDNVWCVAWSPNGERALSASADRTLRLWEIATGHCLAVLEGHTDYVWSTAWSPDGSRALSGSYDRTVRLWEVATGRCLSVYEGHTGDVQSVAWRPDGRHAATASSDRTIRLWDTFSGRCLSVLEGHKSIVCSVAWNPNGRLVLSASDDRTLRLWEAVTGRCLLVFEGHTDDVESIAWSPDGRHALSASSDETVRLWDTSTGRCVTVFKGHEDDVWNVAWSPNGQRALSASSDRTVRLWETSTGRCLVVFEGHVGHIWSVAWSPDGLRVFSASSDCTARLWESSTKRCLAIFEGHASDVYGIAWSPDGKCVLSASDDRTVRMWEAATKRCLAVFEGHSDSVSGVAWSPDGSRALSSSHDRTVRLWETATGRCLAVFEGHSDCVRTVAWSPDGRHALSASNDRTVRLWDAEKGHNLAVFRGHNDRVESVAWSPDGKRVLSASGDRTVRLWDAYTGRCSAVFEGHSDCVCSVAWSPDGQHALSASSDRTVRLWEITTGSCLTVFEGHSDEVLSVSWSPDGKRAFSASVNGECRIWTCVLEPIEAATRPRCYTNAKVLLVGDSGVGKTGLSQRLARSAFKATTSTDGVWATQLALPMAPNADLEREIWLWDFAGQADYRLVQQLFMDHTAAAVLVFDPQDEKWYEGLAQWDRELSRSSRRPFAKLLVAGRIDRGGLVVSNDVVERFMKDRGFRPPLHLTSAISGEGCEVLKNAVAAAIDWDAMPRTSTPELYKRLKDEILELRDAGILLLRLAELNQRLDVSLVQHPFKLEELETVIGLLAGPGLIQRLDFGGFVLLQPAILSRYASALVRKVRKHPQEFGCILETELLAGDLDYQEFTRLPRADEEVLLRALLETCVQRAWCMRQAENGHTLLTFPSYFRKERPESPEHPNVLVTYRFDGVAEEIYATLVVRLHHTLAFESPKLWKDAADFKDHAGGKLGLALHREGEGTARLEFYFEPGMGLASQVTFLRYAHEHLLATATNVRRLRRYYCQNLECDSQEVTVEQARIDRALASGKDKVFCADCGHAISLWDKIEEKFDSPELKEEVRRLQRASGAEIENERQELALDAHANAIAEEAGQIYRNYAHSDQGIDGEIEFKDEDGLETGRCVYLLRSGDSYLRERKHDRAEIFRIKEEAWASYWQELAYPVMLVIRNSDGRIRWMNVTEYLRRETARQGRLPKQIEFDGERFDAFTLRQMRDRVLGAE